MTNEDKNTLTFCIDFTKNNFREHSQVSMCQVWLKKAVDIINADPSISSANFIINEISAVNKYLTGSDTSSTSETIYAKLGMIETLIKDI